MKTLIKGGRLIDPANKTDAYLNLLLENGRVALVTGGCPAADETVDASGRIVCPGFIDIHMHEDPVGSDGKIRVKVFDCMLKMGVTTAVGGNCGSAKYDPAAYLDIVERDGAPVNVAMLAAHSYFRHRAGVKSRYDASTEEQRQRIEKLTADALSRGCAGVSFGLRYVPGTDADEFNRVVRCVSGTGKIITAHVRNDAAYVFESIKEAADAALAAGVPLEVSHIGSMAGFGQMKDTLRLTDEYRMNGLDITLDCYPYDAFSTSLGSATYDDGWLERYGCGYDVLEFCEGEFAGQRATEETFRKVRRELPSCVTVCHVMLENEVELALMSPSVMIGSDATLNEQGGHPRASGTFPRVLRFAREGKLSLYSAIEKMTSMPASRLGLSAKGRLNAGADADIVIFDPDTITDRATFEEPFAAPEGIDRVIIGGQTAYKDGVTVCGRLGQAVRIFNKN
ncbi:MAG: amidohydrolase family protein [Clostridia bacterium]|nr:amidohydrolase family protein [Clostridia bacterium]